MWLESEPAWSSSVSMKWVGRVAHHGSPAETRGSFVTEAANGIRYVWAEPRLRLITIAAAVANLVVGFIEGTWKVLYTVITKVDSPAQTGLLLSMLGVGGVIGAFIAPSFHDYFGEVADRAIDDGGCCPLGLGAARHQLAGARTLSAGGIDQQDAAFDNSIDGAVVDILRLADARALFVTDR